MKLAKHLRLADDNSIYICEHRSIDRRGNKREKKERESRRKARAAVSTRSSDAQFVGHVQQMTDVCGRVVLEQPKIGSEITS